MFKQKTSEKIQNDSRRSRIVSDVRQLVLHDTEASSIQNRSFQFYDLTTSEEKILKTNSERRSFGISTLL